LHFQAPPHAETKVVRAVLGRVLDVFVDIRKSSPSYGVYCAVELDAERQNVVYIPKGCAHAYLTLTDETIVAYKVDSMYAPYSEGGLFWNDPKLNIDWGMDGDFIISEKDQKWPTWDIFESPFK
jgi:dTDP-4-dehydrorhamnose 3,5-epimerase